MSVIKFKFSSNYFLISYLLQVMKECLPKLNFLYYRFRGYFELAHDFNLAQSAVKTKPIETIASFKLKIYTDL